MKKLPFFPLAIFILTFSSCKLEPNWDVDALAPIAETTLTPGNIFRDSNLIVQPGGDLVLDYEARVFEFPVDSILKIPDSTYTYNFISPFTLFLDPGTTLPVYNNYLLFNLPDIGLREALLRGGQLRVKVISTLPQPSIINFKILKASKAGVSFDFTDNVPAAAAGGTAEYIRDFDISWYNIDFSGDNNDQYNKLRLQIFASLPLDAQSFQVPPGQELIRTEISFVEAQPYFARGKINTRSINIAADTVKLPFFDLIQSGALDIESANLDLTVNNGFGVDARAVFNSITGVNTRTGNTVALNHPILGNNINLNAAQLSPSGNLPFTPSNYVLNISTNNSNLEPFATNFPNKISIDGNFTINPLGNLSSGNDFVFFNATAAVNMHLTAPLTFSANNLLLSDTVAFNGESLSKNNPAKNGSLKIYAENMFPFELELRLQTVDSLGNILGTPANGQLIAAGIAESDGRVYQPVSSIVNVELSETDMLNLKSAKGVIFQVRFHSLPAGQLMKIYHDYRVHLKAVALITAGI